MDQLEQELIQPIAGNAPDNFYYLPNAEAALPSV
jgi:hypothetical protein